MSGTYGIVEAAARAAARAAPSLASEASVQMLDRALTQIAFLLEAETATILKANGQDLEAGREMLSPGMLDRLQLDEARLAAIAGQVRSMAALPPLERVAGRWTLSNGLVVEKRRVPVGVIGAIYEARPNVSVDVAAQLIKSGNAGVLRTGSASLRTAVSIIDWVLAPALGSAGLPPEAIQLVRVGGHEAAEALVCLPKLVPLVIIRGSGETTAHLARLAAQHGVRTLSHAEGGGVLYVHQSASPEMALGLIKASLDRLGVCNRLNWLLIDRALWESFLPRALETLRALGVDGSLPPYDHPLSHEWATDPERDATVTIVPVEVEEAAVATAHKHTSGLAAAIVAEDEGAARRFLDSYRGTGVFWNATTRWLDGYELTGSPETGINIDQVPGPRGPVTYSDLNLRQYVVVGDGSQRR